MAVRQLRIYTIPVARRDAFYARWRTWALPLMEEHGFRVVETWEGTVDPIRRSPVTQVLRLALSARNLGRGRAQQLFEFGYVLEWGEEDRMRRSWTTFLADDRWRRAKAVSRRSTGGEPVVLVTDRILARPA